MKKNPDHFRRERKFQIYKGHFPRHFCSCKHLTARKKKGSMYCWNKISARRACLSFGNPLVHLETNRSYVQSSWIWDASSSLQQFDHQHWSQSVGLVSSRAVVLLTKSRRFELGTPCSYGINILLSLTEFTEAVTVCFQLEPTTCWKEMMGFVPLLCAVPLM